MKVFLATANLHKIKEIKKVLENVPEIEIITLKDGVIVPDVIEDGKTFEENSIKKAVETAKYMGMITIADDSGLCVEALNGAPGVYSARYAGRHGNDLDNNKKLVENLKNIENRNAKFVCVITIANKDGEYKTFYGEMYGKIIDEPLGTNGFGYDPHFYLIDYDKTVAEISDEKKNEISHRGMALKNLKKIINETLKELSK
ncbi:XTP/dITP diphosphatase [Fusobacterium sp. PH5-44]|uniref:XTP/dITP diphosphatase n=1 Tax=unclassified Fusobacterium TaxID=2648384 RepID=UPI003D1E23E5